MRVKKDDTVVVIAGKDKGKKGKVVAVLPKQDKVVVEGVNIITKHQKPTATLTFFPSFISNLTLVPFPVSGSSGITLDT